MFSSDSSLTDKVIPRQLFEISIQAAIGKKIVARENLSAYRADVTAGLYGGIIDNVNLLRLHLMYRSRALRAQTKAP